MTELRTPARRLREFKACVIVLTALVGCGQRSGQAGNSAHGAPPGAAPVPDASEHPAAGEEDAAVSMLEHPFPNAAVSPSLEGGTEWINAAGPIDLRDLRGKFVVLDFWTYCCINCMHLIPELKKLERAFPDSVVVIGVHSAKFDAEKDSENIRDAVLRHEIEHPIVNDANHILWEKFAANSWPSIRVIDPEGKLVAGQSGELPFEAFEAFFRRVLPYYKARGLLDRSPVHFELESHRSRATPLRYPGKVLADASSRRLFIADSNHNRIVVSDLEGQLLHVIGSGVAGRNDGGFDVASFDHPQGMALRGEVLYVADTENHLLRKVDLNARRVTTIAGTGEQARNPWPGTDGILDRTGGAILPRRFVGPPRETPLSSPWDLWIHEENLYVAMAGPHQIWRMPLDESEIGPFAGNGREDIVDGRLLPPTPYELGYSSFAQPSGLASDGRTLFVADSEGSSIRAVDLGSEGLVRTVVGTAHLDFARLFTFGDLDGDARTARLQHPLGLTLVDGKLYVADTYNNKIKIVDPTDGTTRTLLGTGERGQSDEFPAFDEPAGISHASGKLYVADTNNHAIRVIDLANQGRVSTLVISNLDPPANVTVHSKTAEFPPGVETVMDLTEVRPVNGKLHFALAIELPDDWKLNPRAPMRYQIEARPGAGVVDRKALPGVVRLDPPAKEITGALALTEDSGEDELRITWQYYYCREGAEGLCKMGVTRWRVPLRIDPHAGCGEIALQVEPLLK